MLKYFKNISLRLFFIVLGALILLTAWAWLAESEYIRILILLSLLTLFGLAWWLARSIQRIHRYAEAMAANRTASPPQFGDSYFYRLVNAITHLRDELNHRQHIENYVLGLTHELKTPLTAQRAALELLQDTDLSLQQQNLLERILRNTHKQHELITRLLELARLENRDSLQETQAIDLIELAKQAVQDCATSAQSITLDNGCAPIVQGDPLLLRQAIDNLLYNALDFAPKHSEIRLFFTCETEQIALHIFNQGDPIPDYALAKIPQRFFSLPRVNGARSSGLGLSFVSEIMRLHHGYFRLCNQNNGVCASLIFVLPSKT